MNFKTDSKTKLRPDKALAAIVGSEARPRPEIMASFWEYIKEHDLDSNGQINIDAKLKPVFQGHRRVSIFLVANLVGKHLKSVRKR